MEIIKINKQNFLTKTTNKNSLLLVLFLILIVTLLTSIYHSDLFHLKKWSTATHQNIFYEHQYYRLWITLFVHSDLEHLGSNMLLFFPFAYFVYGQFGTFFFPVLGIFLGGLINYIVLYFMPNNIELIGISGVVYWLGAAYIMGYLLIENRTKFRKRLINAVGILLILFFPTTLQQNISYLSHFIGLILGIISALFFYVFNYKKIKSFEFYDYKIEYDEDELMLIKSLNQ